jgi:hypothetical protein
MMFDVTRRLAAELGAHGSRELVNVHEQDLARALQEAYGSGLMEERKRVVAAIRAMGLPPHWESELLAQLPLGAQPPMRIGASEGEQVPADGERAKKQQLDG